MEKTMTKHKVNMSIMEAIYAQFDFLDMSLRVF
jgi:hypothetical protein